MDILDTAAYLGKRDASRNRDRLGSASLPLRFLGGVVAVPLCDHGRQTP
jgi:hypothetical protein